VKVAFEESMWGSHFITLLRIESMWNSTVKVLSMIHEDEPNPGRAGGLVKKMESFSFVFNMKLMLKVLRITNELSLLLQKKRSKYHAGHVFAYRYEGTFGNFET
jgi:hypothetical protein